MTDQTHPWQVGQELAYVRRGGLGSGFSVRKVKVAKILKMDRIKIEGDVSYWRVFDERDYYSEDKTPQWKARRIETGTGYSSVSVYLKEYDDKLKAEVNAQNIKNRVLTAQNDLAKIDPARVTAEQLVALEALIKELQA